MNNSAERILYRKSALIFEQMAFLMPRPDNDRDYGTGNVSAVIHFRGAFSGYLVVSISTETARQLPCYMLADETLSDETLQKDSLGEIAHVICGNALPAIFGNRSTFELKPPLIYEREKHVSATDGFSQVAQALISFDTGKAEVNLFVENGAMKALSP